jgi:hypothetical protein
MFSWQDSRAVVILRIIQGQKRGLTPVPSGV